jgi:serine phosphatase RsbU (regulator of sigma subunit)
MLPHERHADNVFATLCSVAIPPDRRAATVHLAGHPAPILIDDSGVCVLDVPSAAPPLGIYEQDVWPGKQAQLGGSWSLLLYTDGLIEGRIGQGDERLGEERLVAMVERHLAENPNWHGNRKELLNAIITEVEQLNGEPVTDDIAVLLLSSNGGS